MRLLIYTQKVDKNDPVLGFFHQWIEEFAEHLDALEVVCLEKGEYTLPGNARVTSLGREEGKGRMTYVWRFYKHLFQPHSYIQLFGQEPELCPAQEGLPDHLL